jgi:hypothetical protein
MVNRWVDDIRWSLLPAIQIAAYQGAPIISIDHTVWIQHSYDLEDEVFFEQDGFLVIWINDELDDAPHHP